MGNRGLLTIRLLAFADASTLATPSRNRSGPAVRPGNHFNLFANQIWIGSPELPAGQSSHGPTTILVETDIHAPGAYRGDAVRNIDAWYGSLGVRAGAVSISVLPNALASGDLHGM